MGDIAVRRTSGCLLGHRVIGLGDHDGRAYVTRDQIVRTTGATPPHMTTISWRRTYVERKGGSVPLAPTAYPSAVRRYLSTRLALIDAAPPCASRARGCVGESARSPCVSARCPPLVSHKRSGVRFTVHVPLNATLGRAALREFDPRSFDPDHAGRAASRSLDAYRFHRRPRAQVGSITVSRRPPGAWQLESRPSAYATVARAWTTCLCGRRNRFSGEAQLRPRVWEGDHGSSRHSGLPPLGQARGQEGSPLLRPGVDRALQQRLPPLLHQPAGRRPGGSGGRAQRSRDPRHRAPGCRHGRRVVPAHRRRAAAARRLRRDLPGAQAPRPAGRSSPTPAWSPRRTSSCSRSIRPATSR